MKYSNTVKAVFINRPNRFVANVDISGVTETVHVKNTGRCTGLLVPGCEVILSDEWASGSVSRKTRYDLVAALHPQFGWINIDSQMPNKAVKEWLEKGLCFCSDKTDKTDKDGADCRDIFPGIVGFRPEYVFGDSRLDFLIEREVENAGSGTDCAAKKRQVLMEVKGCTLQIDGIGYFPDAPTTRGAKHLRELAGASDKFDRVVAFVIAMNNVSEVRPMGDIDPVFEQEFYKARAAGVKVLYLMCEVGNDGSAEIKKSIMVE